MRKKIFILLSMVLCVSFAVLSGIGIYLGFSMRGGLQQLEHDFGEEIAEHISSRAQEQTMKSVKALTVARADHIDNLMNNVVNDVRILSGTMTRIVSNPHNYAPQNTRGLVYADDKLKKTGIFFSEELFYKRSPALEQELSLVANIVDSLKDTHNNFELRYGDCYVASDKGYTIFVDTNGQAVNVPFDARKRNWYKTAKDADKIIFCHPYIDWEGKTSLDCVAPYYENGKFAGVVGIGSDVNTWYDLLMRPVLQDGLACFILNKNGNVIFSSTNEDFLEVSVDDIDLTKSADEKIASLANNMVAGKTGIKHIIFSGKHVYVSYAPMKNTGWSLGMITPNKEAKAVANDVKKYVIGRFRDFQQEIDGEYIRFSVIGGACLVIILVLLGAVSNYLAIRLAKPVNELTDGVKEIADGNLDKKLNIRTKDEMQTLAENFNTMTERLKTQMASLKKVTAEKERIATELDIAKKIQMSMLPTDFSLDKRIDIFASTIPAKEVGGDLYDFYMLDEDHLFITIADVSGKGVPAALFMVAAITNLRNFTAALSKPYDLKQAIENAANKLCVNNKDNMFVTAFSGILDLTTGKFSYVNAGHNPPLIRREGENFLQLPVELNFVLGGWEDWHYVGQEISLEKGDALFLYTDGVTEAVNANGEMYSMKRLETLLNKTDKSASSEKILKNIRESLNDFSRDAEQSDDITMLAVRFEGSR